MEGKYICLLSTNSDLALNFSSGTLRMCFGDDRRYSLEVEGPELKYLLSQKLNLKFKMKPLYLQMLEVIKNHFHMKILASIKGSFN